MESLEREQKQIDCQADELEVELRRVMNTGKENFIYKFNFLLDVYMYVGLSYFLFIIFIHYRK